MVLSKTNAAQMLKSRILSSLLVQSIEVGLAKLLFGDPPMSIFPARKEFKTCLNLKPAIATKWLSLGHRIPHLSNPVGGASKPEMKAGCWTAGAHRLSQDAPGASLLPHMVHGSVFWHLKVILHAAHQNNPVKTFYNNPKCYPSYQSYQNLLQQS